MSGVLAVKRLRVLGRARRTARQTPPDIEEVRRYLIGSLQAMYSDQVIPAPVYLEISTRGRHVVISVGCVDRGLSDVDDRLTPPRARELRRRVARRREVSAL